MPAAEEAAVWATFLAELRRWADEDSGGLVPTTAVTRVDGRAFNLGSRVKNARVYYHRGALTDEQIAELEAIPGWSWHDRNARSRVTRDSHLEALRAHAEVQGSAAGLQRADQSLAKWLQQERRRDLTPAERAELQSIPRALEAPTYYLDRLIADLTLWINAMPGRDASHLLRSTTVDIDGQLVRLGERAADWRRRYRRGDLTKQETQRLSAVPGWSWEARSPGRRPRAIEQLGKD